jgi:salicylate hydroxylase
MFAQAILTEYDSLRVPRATMVHQRSREAGEIYDSYGTKYNAEQLQEHLSGIWDPVWDHDLQEDVVTAFERLKYRGIFT